MSHKFKVETGRWSRMPRERRSCLCNNNQVQTEKHVLLDCPITENLRDRYAVLTFASTHTLMNEKVHLKELCGYVYNVLSTFS